MEKIRKAFNQTCNDYSNLFKTHYSKASGGGLNEATQTHCFCKNLVKILNKGIKEEL